MANSSMAVATLLPFVIIAFLLLSCLPPTDAQVGVAYGREGDNLPSPIDVVNLCKSNGIGAMRIYFPDKETLDALKDSGIKLTLGVGNDDIKRIGSFDQSVADQWVQTNVVPYVTSIDIKYIVVGNEVKTNDEQAPWVLLAMQKVHFALSKNSLSDKIKVTTSIGTESVINAFPPSAGQFRDLGYMKPIIDFLKDKGSPLMVNIYPYFAHKYTPQDISLEYALFTMPIEKAVNDSKNGLTYQNVFDALADATYAAIDKAGGGASTMKISDVGVGEEKASASNQDISLITSESGWSSNNGKLGNPSTYNAMLSEGGDDATVDNAKTYYTNLIEHVKKGTPLKPGKPIETFLFALIDEDKKFGEGDEHHFGLFTADMNPKYGSLNFGG